MPPIIVLADVSTYDWLLFLHVTGAFLLAGGAVAAGAFNVAAQIRKRPSEVAFLFRLVQICVVAIGIGSLMTLGFGLWLVDAAPWEYGYGQAWIVAAIILWFVVGAMGGAGGKRDRETRELAVRLAAGDDVPTTELRARLRDPVALFLSYGSGLAIFAILVLMVWKPGA